MPVPLGPTMASRSAQATSIDSGPRRKDPRSITASTSRATTSPLRVDGASARCRSHPSQGFSATSSRSRAFSVMRTLAACFSVRLTLKPFWALSWSDGFFLSDRTPVTAHWRWVRARSVRSERCVRYWS